MRQWPYDCRMHSLDQFAQDWLDRREANNLRRAVTETAPSDGIFVIRKGRRLLSFCSNDYLNLTQHPALKQAAKEAIDRFGVGAGASRLITGSHPLYTELEARLARLKGTEAACVFGSGYLANSGIIPALAGEGDLIVADELAHSCIRTGMSLSGAELALFRHNDVTHAREILAARREQYRHTLLVTEGVFSMDGDLAPLEELAELAGQYDAWLMTDDAHGIGVLGDGRGSSFAGGRAIPVPLQMGTLSKAIGGYGGYLCASKAVIELMQNRARTMIYSTGLPPATIAAAIAALEVIERDPAYAAQPLQKAQSFTALTNLPRATSPIVPLLIGDSDKTMTAAKLLEDEGFLVVGIRPPTVPEGTARLRFTFTALHDDRDIARVANIVRERIIERNRD
jgi:8-amino-7-oxononanoate synthase